MIRRGFPVWAAVTSVQPRRATVTTTTTRAGRLSCSGGPFDLIGASFSGVQVYLGHSVQADETAALRRRSRSRFPSAEPDRSGRPAPWTWSLQLHSGAPVLYRRASRRRLPQNHAFGST